MVSSAKSQGGHEFCSINCSIRAAPRLQEQARIARDAQSIHGTIPLMALAHAAAPLLLYLLMRAIGGPDPSIQRIAVVLFWSWPIWLWPLIRYRHRNLRLFGMALVLALIVLVAAALPMLAMSFWSLPGEPQV
jgi:hypothetical protein